MKTITKSSIKKELNKFSYYLQLFNEHQEDLLICKCGNKIIFNSNAITYNIQEGLTRSTYETEFDTSNILFGKRKLNVFCTKCRTDYSLKENSNYVQNLNNIFFDRFNLIENEKDVIFYRFLAGKNYRFENDKVILTSEILESYIKINKKTNKIYIKQFGKTKHVQIHLENVYKEILEFFKDKEDISYKDGFINVHDWIGKLAKQLRDVKNMNVVEELMGLMTGTDGIEVLQKIAVIFLSILIYPNLSTISLTKGNIFLYDLIANCPMPNRNYLKKEKATSPLKIFNTLIVLKNDFLQKKLDSDDTSILKNENQSTAYLHLINKLKAESHKIQTNSDHIKREGGQLVVRDKVKNLQISPLLFNKITSFKQYVEIINWLRLIKYEELLRFIQKYEIDFLLNAYKGLEFREDLTSDRINQFLLLMFDYCKQDFYVNRMGESINIDYTPASIYSFDLYDDCHRMIIELQWDPKVVLFKTKTNMELNTLHQNLLKHRSYVSNNEINKRFVEFSSKFKFLEKYSDDLKIYLSIHLIETPEELMNEAVEMHNCAGSYIRRVANGEYLSFIVYDNSPEKTSDDYDKYMMVLEITPLGLEFVGVKAKFNKYGTNRFKDDIIKYLVDKDIIYKQVPSISKDIQSKEVSYEGFYDKITKS